MLNAVWLLFHCHFAFIWAFPDVWPSAFPAYSLINCSCYGNEHKTYVCRLCSVVCCCLSVFCWCGASFICMVSGFTGWSMSLVCICVNLMLITKFAKLLLHRIYQSNLPIFLFSQMVAVIFSLFPHVVSHIYLLRFWDLKAQSILKLHLKSSSAVCPV